jgi:hypothetical protein
MLIWDKKGEYVQTYFREGIDIIFNPLDARFPGWSPFCETDTTFGFLALAYSLIPAADNDDQKDSFFKEGSRTIFDLVMRQLHAEGRRSLTDLKEVLMGMKPAEIAKYLNHGAGGAVYISPDAAEQAGGVLSTLFGAIKLIEFVPSGSFSLREWARRDDDSRLFITSPDATAHEMLLPITRMFIDIVLRAAMSCELIHHDRLWIFLDECASLGALPTLKHSLTEGRIFGMCHIVGLQNIAQWHAVHDDNVAKTMRSNLQNFLILRVTDEDTQEAYSKLLGAQEIDEQSEGLSYGAASNRDGENLQTSRKEKRIVLPSEIKRLPDCTGYLQLAGAYDVAKVSYTYKPRPIIAAGFILRNELLLANQPAPTAIAAVADPDTGELPGSLYDDDELPIAVEPAPTPKAYTLDDF